MTRRFDVLSFPKLVLIPLLSLVAMGAFLVGSPRVTQAADSAEAFYKGRTVFLQMGSEPGGGYDVVGRLVARTMSKYMPGHPTIVPQNVPGGGSLVLANQFAKTTKRDGSVFGLMSNGMPTTPLLDPNAARFDPRQFAFLGSTSRETEILVVWHTAKVKTLADIFTTPLLVGASSPGSATHDFPYLTNALLGTKFKIVLGYKGATEVKLAMQRGEVEANAALAWGSAKTQYADVLKNKDLLVIGQYGSVKDVDLPDVPLIPRAKSDADQQILDIIYARMQYGRPFLTPPGVPQDRVDALRTAFEATLKDPAFLAEAKKAKVDVEPVSAKELQDLTDRLFRTPPDVVARLRALLKPKK